MANINKYKGSRFEGNKKTGERKWEKRPGDKRTGTTGNFGENKDKQDTPRRKDSDTSDSKGKVGGAPRVEGRKWEKRPGDKKTGTARSFEQNKDRRETERGKESDTKDSRSKIEGAPRVEGRRWDKRPDTKAYSPNRFEKSKGRNEAFRTNEYAREDSRDITEDITRLEGRNPVMEALKAGRTIEKLMIAKGDKEGSIRQIISMAREKGIVIIEVDREKLDAMSELKSHQGVIALVSPYSYVELDEILESARNKNEQPFVIVLDEIYDPYNLGSILRTANACGAHGVIIPKRRAVGLTPAVAKASAGAIEYVKVAKVTNITQTLKVLKEKGLWIVGADMNGKKTYFEAGLTGPIALVIGNEGEGIGKLIRENCDFLVSLPMMGEISSLNAGVAGAIVMYEIVRQRIIKK